MATDTLSEAEAAERAAIEAIKALGEAEIDAVKVWVASGCEGEQPRPDAEARRVLTETLMAAIEAREAAERALPNAMAGPINNSGLRSCDSRIVSLKFQSIQSWAEFGHALADNYSLVVGNQTQVDIAVR
jgi:hypothetical protein